MLDILKRWNFWDKEIDCGIKRKAYLEKILPFVDRKEIVVLKGIRRSGKSTILKQIMYEVVNNKKASKKQILYLNLEDYNFSNELSLEFLENVFSLFKKQVNNKEKTYFLIDEIQKIPMWERWIRTKYDQNENIKFIITGSSASMISKKLSTLLTGRNISFTIMPLSFKECRDFGVDSLNEYLYYGGFPEVVLERDNNKKMVILQQYLDDIIYKDIIDRYKIRNTKQLIEIAKYFISNSGLKVSLNKLSKVFGISKDTILAYINYLIDSYLIRKVTYFSFSLKIKHDVTKLPKLYCIDNGLICSINIKCFKNTGKMFENSVLIKLLEKNNGLSYWSDLNSEVDFIMDGCAINVTSTDKIEKRETDALTNFILKNKNFSQILVTKSVTKDYMISLKDFLLKDDV